MKRGWFLGGVVAVAVIGSNWLPLAAGRSNEGRQAGALPTDDASVVHLLSRTTFGVRPGDVSQVRRAGIGPWIDAQLNPARVSDGSMAERLVGLSTVTMSPADLAREYFIPAQMDRRQRQRDQPASGGREASEAVRRERTVMAELARQKVLRAVYSERQLEEVMVDFWFNHFNVFAGKGATKVYVTAYERDTIRPHALGSFRTLLGAVAESPAMLFYLDNWMSSDPGRNGAGRADVNRPRVAQGDRRRGLNENYARELMELHTLGVDGGYTQQDVTEVARAFTGWTIDRPQQGGGFRFAGRQHDPGKKLVLGRVVDAGGQQDGREVLDLLAAHPSTARFIATKLARRFVCDDPPASLVDRVARRFTETRGDIREVVRAALTSPEFWAPEYRRVKVKTPLEFVLSMLRSAGASVSDALPVVNALRDLGMAPYACQPPTGYADRADAWVNAGALLNRMNLAVALANSRTRGVTVDLAALGSTGSAGDRERLASRLLLTAPSAATQAQLERAESAPQFVALVLGSPDFQRR